MGTTNYQQLIVVSKDSNVKTAHSSADKNVNTNSNNSKTMIQQPVNVQAPPPRLHPKKRKFDLSELEDDHSATTTATSTIVTTINNPVTISSPPEKIALLYKTTDSNGSQLQPHNYATYSNTHHNIVTQVVKNTGEAQQIIKRQYQASSYR